MNARWYRRLEAAVAGLVAPATATACTSAVLKRAGRTAQTDVSVVLTLANVNNGVPAQPSDRLNQVHDLSHDSIRIDVNDAGQGGQPDAETQTVKDVKQGKDDMAWSAHGPRTVWRHLIPGAARRDARRRLQLSAPCPRTALCERTTS